MAVMRTSNKCTGLKPVSGLLMIEALFALLLFAASLISLRGLQAQIMEQGRHVSVRSGMELALHQLANNLPAYRNQTEYSPQLFDASQAQEFFAQCIPKGRFDEACACLSYNEVWRQCGVASCANEEALKYFLLQTRCNVLAIHPVSSLAIHCFPEGKQPCTQSDRLILTVAWKTASTQSTNQSSEPSLEPNNGHLSERCLDLLQEIQQSIKPAEGSTVRTLPHCIEIMS